VTITTSTARHPRGTCSSTAWAETAPQWRPLAQHLSTGAGLIAIDLAGHGAASHVAGPYRISRYAADVAEIANRYVSDGAILIAHSMGAAICLEAAPILRGAARRGDWP